jgi:hypothetical protein
MEKKEGAAEKEGEKKQFLSACPSTSARARVLLTTKNRAFGGKTGNQTVPVPMAWSRSQAKLHKKGKKKEFQRQKTNSTRASHVLTHRTTGLARRSLTSGIGRDRVQFA